MLSVVYYHEDGIIDICQASEVKYVRGKLMARYKNGMWYRASRIFSTNSPKIAKRMVEQIYSERVMLRTNHLQKPLVAINHASCAQQLSFTVEEVAFFITKSVTYKFARQCIEADHQNVEGSDVFIRSYPMVLNDQVSILVSNASGKSLCDSMDGCNIDEPNSINYLPVNSDGIMAECEPTEEQFGEIGNMPIILDNPPLDFHIVPNASGKPLCDSMDVCNVNEPNSITNLPVNSDDIMTERESTEEQFGEIENMPVILDNPPLDLQIVDNVIVEDVSQGKSFRKMSTKKEFCVFCMELKTNISRHFTTVHRQEEVQKFFYLPNKSMERQKQIELLRKRGQMQFNTNNNLNQGNFLTVSRKNVNKHNAAHYRICPNCKGYYARDSIRRHIKVCAPQYIGERSTGALGRKLEAQIHNLSCDVLKDKIFPYMRPDAITDAVRYDVLAINSANNWCKKYKLERDFPMIRGRIRLLGRFLIAVRSINPKIKELKDIFYPQLYHEVLAAINEVAKFNDTNSSYCAPASAHGLGSLIKKVGEVYKIMVISENNESGLTNLNNFLTVFNHEISNDVNRTVRENMCEADNRCKYIRACKLLRQYSIECGASQPLLLRGTLLRKQAATYASQKDFNDSQVQNLANHLGHETKIFREIYCQPLVKKQLSLSAFLEEAHGNIKNIQSNSDRQALVEDMESSDSDVLEMTPTNRTSPTVSNEAVLLASQEIKDLAESSSTSFQTPENRKKSSSRHSWSSEEKEIVKELFSTHIKTKTSPSMYEVCMTRAETKALQNLNETQILGCVNNLIAKENRIKPLDTLIVPRRWESTEIQCVKQHFQHYIEQGRLPSEAECENLIKQNCVLSLRMPLMVKAWVNNYIKRKSK